MTPAENALRAKVYSAIDKLCGDSVLDQALLLDVARESNVWGEQLRDAVESLEADGIITTGDAINDTYIKIVQYEGDAIS